MQKLATNYIVFCFVFKSLEYHKINKEFHSLRNSAESTNCGSGVYLCIELFADPFIVYLVKISQSVMNL